MAHDFDVTLKQLIQESRGVLLSTLLGGSVEQWLNVELPKVENPRVDLLARMESGEHVHLELQSANDPRFAQRQAEYYLALYRKLGGHVRQVMLYVGREPLRMSPVFETPAMHFRYSIVDARDLPGEPLLGSADLNDNIFALLTNVEKERVIHRVLQRLDDLEPRARAAAGQKFVILSLLRGFEKEVKERTERHMPVTFDFNQSELFGPIYRKGLEEGREEGRVEGRQKGREEGRELGREQAYRELLTRQLTARFGDLPDWVHDRLQMATDPELEDLATRLLKAESLAALFER